MGEIINKEYLTRDDLLAMRKEIDHVIATMEIMGQRIGNLMDMLGIQEQQIAELRKLTAKPSQLPEWSI